MFSWAATPAGETLVQPFTYNIGSGQTTVQVGRLITESACPDIFWRWVALPETDNETALRSALNAAQQNNLQTDREFFPVEVRNGIPYWGVRDSVTGGIQASQLIVGTDPPPWWMANEVLNQGPAFTQDSMLFQQYMHDPRPTLDMEGAAYKAVLLVCTNDMPEYIQYEGDDVPAQAVWDLWFADQCLTPGGRIVSSVKHNYDSSAHGHSTYEPETERGGALAGFLNPVDEQGRFILFPLGISSDELDNNYSGSAAVLQYLIIPRAIELGWDIDLENINFRHSLSIVYNDRWETRGLPFWPHASGLGAGINMFGLFYSADMDFTGAGVINHEDYHSIAGCQDHYGQWGDDNAYDIMGRASYNGGHGGDYAPYLSAPDRYLLGWGDFYQLNSDMVGMPTSLQYDDGVLMANPQQSPGEEERIIFAWINAVGNDAHIGFTGVRGIAWWSYPDQQCGQFG